MVAAMVASGQERTEWSSGKLLVAVQCCIQLFFLFPNGNLLHTYVAGMIGAAFTARNPSLRHALITDEGARRTRLPSHHTTALCASRNLTPSSRWGSGLLVLLVRMGRAAADTPVGDRPAHMGHVIGLSVIAGESIQGPQLLRSFRGRSLSKT
jgi:hypothetical protein